MTHYKGQGLPSQNIRLRSGLPYQKVGIDAPTTTSLIAPKQTGSSKVNLRSVFDAVVGSRGRNTTEPQTVSPTPPVPEPTKQSPVIPVETPASSSILPKSKWKGSKLRRPPLRKPKPGPGQMDLPFDNPDEIKEALRQNLHETIQKIIPIIKK